MDSFMQHILWSMWNAKVIARVSRSIAQSPNDNQQEKNVYHGV